MTALEREDLGWFGDRDDVELVAAPAGWYRASGLTDRHLAAALRDQQ